MSKEPIRILFVTGGGYHDYEKLAPFLTNALSKAINARFEVRFGLETLRDPKFAEKFDVTLYDHCDDEAPDEVLVNAMETTRKGKPTVMIHCAVHAFRKTKRLAEWEGCCGLRSKVHDRYRSLEVEKLDDKNPITKFFPAKWRTEGDELYQMISIDPKSKPLLKVRSVQDGKDHVVCWTYQFGEGRVFATTLGHDMKTTQTPEYIRLVANGILWAAGRLQESGDPAPGYTAQKSKQ